MEHMLVVAFEFHQWFWIINTEIDAADDALIAINIFLRVKFS
jgi:hypothetical protein